MNSMNNKNIKLSYDDVAIIPDIVTDIASRSECNIFDERGKLPIFTAPMDTVIGEKNIKHFLNNNINVVLPRTIELHKRIELGNQYYSFIALSLDEAKKIFVEKDKEFSKSISEINKIRICIDVANGHMRRVIDLIKKIKDEYSDRVVIMAGNIANPKTYKLYEEAGCDYVRCGVGGGDGCLTSSNVSIHMPYFSLLEEIYRIKKEIDGKCKVIADGNIRGYRDIQKALIFADYVMIGSLFNRALESAGKTTYGKCYWVIRGYKIFRPFKTLLNYGRIVNVNNPKILEDWKKGKIVLWKQFYGMSTKLAQKAINPNAKKLKTSEGIVKYQKVEHTLSGWVENEMDYLRSAMSYTNSRTLEEYKDSEYITISTMRANN